MKTKRPITAEEQEFFDSMELNIRRKQVTYRIPGTTQLYIMVSS